MAEAVTNRGTYLPALADLAWRICEESAWQLPAHNSYIRDTPQLPLPDVTRPIVDLFAAETGALIATVCGLLGEDEEGNEISLVDESKALIADSTNAVSTNVVSHVNAIGYISLGSMDASVKALKVARNPEDGAEAVYVEATPENVASGDYAIARPFNIAYKADNLSATAQDFINWILSAEGQAIVTAQKYVAKEPAEYQAAPVAGKIVIGGSSSVGPLMQKLEEAYEALHPEVDIEVQISDSSTGMRGAADGSFDIGMASREVKASELEAGLTPVTICMDGIAVIVNNDNAVEGLTLAQIRDIFTGEIVDWDEVK